jgi:transketolase
VYKDGAYFQPGVGNLLRDGNDVAIIACGLMVAAALEAADELKQKSCLDARVIDMHTIKPIDAGIIKLAAEETNGIVCAEEHVLDGGLGSAVARVVAQTHPAPMEFVGMHNTYAESGDPQDLLRKYGMMPYNIVEAAHRVMSRSMERAEQT